MSVRLLASIGVVALLGCGQGQASQGSSGGVDPGVCRAYFEAVNAYFPRCDLGPAADEPWPNALAPTTDESGFAAAYCEGFASAPGAESLGDEMRKCTSWLASPAACNVPYGSVDLSCYLRGSLPANAPCANGVQCQSGQCAGIGSGPSPLCGRCSELVGSGGSCLSAPGQVCDVGLICGAMQKCISPVKKGEACSGDQSTAFYVPCTSGLSCTAPPGKGTTATCIAPGDPGQACLGGCAFNLDCINGVCSPTPGEGQPCSTTGTPCADGLYCPTEFGIDAGTAGPLCAKFPVVGAGALCLPVQAGAPPPECEAGLQCGAAGVCTPFPTVGSKCPSTGCGQWLVCANGACQPPDASQCH